MSKLNDSYKKIMSEIEEKISNEEERMFVKQKVEELTVMFINLLEKVTDITENRITKIEERQNKIEGKIGEVQNIVDNIESDIYEEEQDYDFEIVCPYCNHEFVAEVDTFSDNKNEISCPECHNIIELDWNDEENSDGCMGHCSSCLGCAEEEEEFTEEEEPNDDNEDDM